MSRTATTNQGKDPTVGPADDAVLRAAFRYYYLSSRQVCRLLYSPGSLTYVQMKLKRLSDAGFLQRIWLPRPAAHGSAPSVYTLARKGLNHLARAGVDVDRRRYRPSEQREHTYLFLGHTLAVNDVLISAELLGRSQPGYELARMLHERDLKRTPVHVEDEDGRMIAVVPDGWLDIRVDGAYQVCLALELDRGTEEQKVWRRKVRGLLAYANGPYQEAFQTKSLTVAVVATPGDKRLLQLIHWTESELAVRHEQAQGGLFVFTAVGSDPAELADLFFSRRWYRPFGKQRVALLDSVDGP
ncbi:MAG: replication-relaxation family protein [Dehalococcoidia bacterium]|nr:replication-relaxation family protein [Dehalococcoidia bacterium]